ncbi:MAG: TapY2 family type IVa secretion system protein [Colwellia sp.]
MNNIVRSILWFVILVLCSTQSIAFANKAKHKANNNSTKITVKCHVNFTNGTEDIVFFQIKAYLFSTFANDIVSREIEIPNHTGKVKIYNALQCVKDEDEFTSNQAKLLDSKNEDR